MNSIEFSNYQPKPQPPKSLTPNGEFAYETIDTSFPTEPMERAGTILSGAINSGPKSLLTILLSYAAYLPTLELVERFRKTVAGSGTLFDNINPTSVARYCEYSLEAVGLVAKVFKTNPESGEPPVGFALTDIGRKFGVRAAAIALNFEHLHSDIPIYPIFGQTASNSKDVNKNDKRSPTIRAKILAYLNDHKGEKINAHTLAKTFPDLNPHTIRVALKFMDTQGVIQIASAVKRGQIHYVQGEKNLDENIEFPQKFLIMSVISEIKKMFKSSGSVTIEGITESLYPDYEKTWKKEVFSHNIMMIINFLKKSGFLKKDQLNFMNYSISPKGEIIVYELIKPLLLLMEDNESFIRHLDDTVVKTVLENLSLYSREAVSIYYPHSQGHKRQLMRNYVDDKILSSLREVDVAGLTSSDLEKVTGVSSRSLPRRLKRLMQEGYITRVNGPKMYLYAITQAGIEKLVLEKRQVE